MSCTHGPDRSNLVLGLLRVVWDFLWAAHVPFVAATNRIFTSLDGSIDGRGFTPGRFKTGWLVS